MIKTPSLIDPGASAGDLTRDLTAAARSTDAGQRDLALHLADLRERGLCELLGWASTTQYAAVQFELGARRAQRLLVVGEALHRLPALDAALRAGVLTWTRVELLASVVTPAVESAWLEVATTVTLSELRHRVAVARRGRPPSRRRPRGPVPGRTVRGELPPAAWETWERARTQLEVESGAPVSDAEMMTRLAARALTSSCAGPGSTS
ncbi:MAG: hypothetical protein CMJ83_00120 [Planctomycetes bacterium]|nr:hypothetical protein [Planctomycetota bacterium]